MTKERIIYNLIFADSSRVRKRQQQKGEEFSYLLRKRVVYEDGIRSYRTLATIRGSERLALENAVGPFPIIIEKGQQDCLTDHLSVLLELRNSYSR